MILKKNRNKQYSFRINEEEFKASRYISGESNVNLPDNLRKCIMDIYNKLIKNEEVDSVIYGGGKNDK